MKLDVPAAFLFALAAAPASGQGTADRSGAPGSILLMVRDSAGRPIDKASIFQILPNRAVAFTPVGETDSSGTFLLGGLAAGCERLTVRHQGYISMLVYQVIEPAKTDTVRVSLSRHEAVLMPPRTGTPKPAGPCDYDGALQQRAGSRSDPAEGRYVLDLFGHGSIGRSHLSERIVLNLTLAPIPGDVAARLDDVDLQPGPPAPDHGACWHADRIDTTVAWTPYGGHTQWRRSGDTVTVVLWESADAGTEVSLAPANKIAGGQARYWAVSGFRGRDGLVAKRTGLPDTRKC